MSDLILDKGDIAKRYGLSKKSVDTAISRNPDSLPKFFKLGLSKNSPVRFRLADCLAYEAEMLAQQEKLQAEEEAVTGVQLTSLLGLK